MCYTETRVSGCRLLKWLYLIPLHLICIMFSYIKWSMLRFMTMYYKSVAHMANKILRDIPEFLEPVYRHCLISITNIA